MRQNIIKTFALIILLGSSSNVLAALTVNFYEQMGDVVAEASGSLDVSGLTSKDSGQSAFIGTDFTTYYGYVFGNILPGTQDSYDVTFTSEQPFGPLAETPTSSSGNTVGIVGELPGGGASGNDVIFLPTGYTSGDTVSGSSIWSGVTLANLNLVPGSYTFVYPSDSITFNVLTAPPPIPAPTMPTAVPVMPFWLLGLMSAALAGIASYRITRKK